MSEFSIVEIFADLPDKRREAGKRYNQVLCLALFTLAVAVGNRGFLAIGDGVEACQSCGLSLSQTLNRAKFPSGITCGVQYDSALKGLMVYLSDYQLLHQCEPLSCWGMFSVAAFQKERSTMRASVALKH